MIFETQQRSTGTGCSRFTLRAIAFRVVASACSALGVFPAKQAGLSAFGRNISTSRGIVVHSEPWAVPRHARRSFNCAGARTGTFGIFKRVAGSN